MSDAVEEARNRVAEKIAGFLEHGQAVLKSHGIAESRVAVGHVPGDTAVWYVTVDEEPVFRVLALMDEKDGQPAIAFHGTWMRAAEKHVGPTTRVLDATDAGEWDDDRETIDGPSPVKRLSN